MHKNVKFLWMIRRTFSSTMLFFIHVRLCIVSARERLHSARAAAKRVCELQKLSFVRERAIVRGGFVEECCSSSAASCENGGDNVKLTECFFSL
jgi:hypothetical protein